MELAFNVTTIERSESVDCVFALRYRASKSPTTSLQSLYPSKLIKAALPSSTYPYKGNPATRDCPTGSLPYLGPALSERRNSARTSSTCSCPPTVSESSLLSRRQHSSLRRGSTMFADIMAQTLAYGSAALWLGDMDSLLKHHKDSMDTVQLFWNRIAALFWKVEERLRVRETYGAVKDFSAKHPIYATCILAALTFSALPLLTFASIILITISVTFLGFLFVNGTVVALGVVTLAGVVCGVGVVVLGLGAVCTTMWCLVDESTRMLGRLSGAKGADGAATSRRKASGAPAPPHSNVVLLSGDAVANGTNGRTIPAFEHLNGAATFAEVTSTNGIVQNGASHRPNGDWERVDT